MEYKYDDVDKIIEFKTWDNRKKINELFRIDTYMYTNMGIDSTKTERDNAKRKSRYIYRAIKNLDLYLGAFLLKANEE